MGIVNVTPDSFSDGGLHPNAHSAVAHALKLVDAGADIIDVGGESTRPGSKSVTAEVELERVLPVISQLRDRSDVLISVDTMKAVVAREAVSQGANIVNDVSGLTMDPDMLVSVAATNAGIVIMHMRGTPETMQDGALACENITGLVKGSLKERLALVEASGIDLERVCIDPGIGFGKTPEQNLELINRLDELGELGRPVLLGVSRKSVLGHVTGQAVEARGAATSAAHAIGVMRGAQIFRVHDVAAARDVISVTCAVMKESLSR